MKFKSLGFIGGGRITNIILEGLARKEKQPEQVFVSETNPEVSAKLQARYPSLDMSAGDVKGPAAAKLINSIMDSACHRQNHSVHPDRIRTPLSVRLSVSHGRDGS